MGEELSLICRSNLHLESVFAEVFIVNTPVMFGMIQGDQSVFSARSLVGIKSLGVAGEEILYPFSVHSNTMCTYRYIRIYMPYIANISNW